MTNDRLTDLCRLFHDMRATDPTLTPDTFKQIVRHGRAIKPGIRFRPWFQLPYAARYGGRQICFASLAEAEACRELLAEHLISAKASVKEIKETTQEWIEFSKWYDDPKELAYCRHLLAKGEMVFSSATKGGNQ